MPDAAQTTIGLSLLSPRYFRYIKVLREAVEMLVELLYSLFVGHFSFLLDSLRLLKQRFKELVLINTDY